MSSSKFSKPKYWAGLFMVSLPILAGLALVAFLVNWKVVVVGIVSLAGIVLCAGLFGKGYDLMMDAEYDDD